MIRSTSQQFSGNIQSNLTAGGKLSGGMSVSTSEADRAWVDNVASLTSGGSMDINVANNTNVKGAMINSESGDLTLNTGTLTYSDIENHDKSSTRGVGVSIGVNPNQDTGGVSGVSATYNDSKKEGITRATIGEGTITVGGAASDGEGVNRDVNKAQEVTFEEGMEATINLPAEFLKDPMGYMAKSPDEIKMLPAKIASEMQKAYKVTVTAYNTFFPEGLNEAQQKQFGEAMASRDPAKINEIVEKFRGKGLSEKDMSLVTKYASGEIGVKEFVDSLSDDGQEIAIYRKLIAWDGTWNDMNKDMLTGSETNVAISKLLYNGEAIYVEGVGTDGFFDKYICGFTGCGSSERREEVFNALKEDYQQNGDGRLLILDNIGFSRGATNSMEFSNEFLRYGLSGLVTPEMAGVYSQVLFDPVASYGLPGNNIDLGYNLTTSPQIGVVITARATDESRALFPYTSSGHSQGNVIELEYPGVHSDIGGGYLSGEGGKSNNLSKIILNEVVNVAIANGIPFGEIPMQYQAAPETKQAFDNYMKAKSTYNDNPTTANSEVYQNAYSSLYDTYIHDSRMWFDFGNTRTTYYPNDAVNSSTLPKNQF